MTSEEYIHIDSNKIKFNDIHNKDGYDMAKKNKKFSFHIVENT